MTATTTVRPHPKHPAKFSAPILDSLGRLVQTEAAAVRKAAGRPLEVLDPFAGVGRIHSLRRDGRILTTGVELEPEWAACQPGTICADFLAWADSPGKYERFDVVATSPTYGNRLADHHNARDGSTRRSYTHDLGRPLTTGNSGAMPWGPRYWEFHAEAARRVWHVLRPGGLLLWNVSDFYKGKTLVPAVAWHRGCLWATGFRQGGRDVPIGTSRLRGVGTEATAMRADHEVILRFRKPTEGGQ